MDDYSGLPSYLQYLPMDDTPKPWGSFAPQVPTPPAYASHLEGLFGVPQQATRSPIEDLLNSRGLSTSPYEQTLRGSQAVGNALQGLAQPVLDAAHYADALTRGQSEFNPYEAAGYGGNAIMAALPFGVGRRAAVTAAEEAIPQVGSALRRAASPADQYWIDLLKRPDLDPEYRAKIQKLLEPDSGPSIRAYHGSPYDFDRFDPAKIGTGEGAQAYGHGLYFAEHEGTARTYKASNFSGDDYLAQDYLNRAGGDYSKALSLVKADKSELDRFGTPVSKTIMQAIRDAQNRPPPGHMYEVALHADPQQFYNYDAANLAGQSQYVQDAFRKAGLSVQSETQLMDLAKQIMARDHPESMHEWNNPGRSRAWTEAYDDAIDKAYAASPPRAANQLDFGTLMGPEGAQALHKAGIPGIRYLDQGSRTAGKGTYNYTVFDPRIIEILRKYGFVGPMAGGGLLSSNYLDQSQ